MCGIAGGVSFDGTHIFNKGDIEKALHIMRFRGPDDSGFKLFEHDGAFVSMCHTRLSIIDLTRWAHQPMISSSEETWITYNGEIYNYREIRHELEMHSFKFHTNSDTEVILNGFECWGARETLQKLDGMFAFALFSKAKGRLYLCRDRFGKKPIYFNVFGKKISFSSDVRIVKDVALNSNKVNLHSLGYYFAELATPESESIWENISKVLPGHYIEFSKQGVSNQIPYWSLNYSCNSTLSYNDTVDKTGRLLSNAVKKRMVADVNVAALLSGGIDSSLVVAKMAENSHKAIKTYSVGFENESYNELPYARQVADKFATDHTEFILTNSDLRRVDDIILEFGEPFADSSMIPTYLISNEIAKTEKVVLGGDGGDELFAGYYSYYFSHKYDKVKWLKWMAGIGKVVSSVLPTYHTKFFKELLIQARERSSYTLLDRHLSFDSAELKLLYNLPKFYNALDREHERVWLRNYQSNDYDLINTLSASLHTRLVNDYLVKIDRASMFASLEMRSPFLDKDLAMFCSSIHPSFYLKKHGTKSILKDIALGYFKPDFVNRKKMGFSAPVTDWFKNDLSVQLKEVILGGKQKLVELDYDYIERLLQDQQKGIDEDVHRIWALYVFHLWAQNQ